MRIKVLTVSLFAVAAMFSNDVFASNADSFRVGTFNIRLDADKSPRDWKSRQKDVIKHIKDKNLDVFGLQEVLPHQASTIDAAFPDYMKFGDHREADRKSGEASSIYFATNRFELIRGGTFWLSETPDVPGSMSWKTAHKRVCSWAYLKDRKTKKEFCFANAHTDHRSALARKEGMLLIIRRMSEFAPTGTPIIFTGDHNCREWAEPAKAVTKILNNAMYVSKKKPVGPWRTYNAWKWIENDVSIQDALKLPKTERGARIDYIYVSKDIKVLDFVTHADARPGLKEYHSDHFLMTATVVLPK